MTQSGMRRNLVPGITVKTGIPLFTGAVRPAVVRTVLTPRPSRVRYLKGQFECLREAADPERQTDE